MFATQDESATPSVLDSRTSGLYVCSRHVSTYCMGLSMAAVEPGFKESLCQALSGREKVSLHVERKEAIRNIVVLKKDTNFSPTSF